MKTLFTLAFLAIISTQGYCQLGFPTEQDDQKWEYVTWNYFTGFCETRFIKNGDLVPLCDNQYIEIFDCDRNESDCRLMGYYRIEGDSVMIRHLELTKRNGVFVDTVKCSRPEGLMYNFAAGIDDTLRCNINHPFGAVEARTDMWSIDERQVDYEGISRKKMNMNYYPYPNFPEEVIFTMNWVEGIGSDVHPFYSLSCIGDNCEQEQQVVRVTRNSQVIYVDTMLRFTVPCRGWITDLDFEKDPAISFTLFPNPAQTKIELSVLSLPQARFNGLLVNNLGKVVGHFKDLQNGSQIPLQAYPSGVYVLQLSNKRWSNLTQRFIIR
ncbi:MAG: T9SS type A sorting domain-containing protein [Bacteroidia bacterium]